MTDDQIKHMVNRFLMWRLPETFGPDAGIDFMPSFKDEPLRTQCWPRGTNLLTATEAEAMVRHMVEGLQ